jgi:hypothetical protein
VWLKRCSRRKSCSKQNSSTSLYCKKLELFSEKTNANNAINSNLSYSVGRLGSTILFQIIPISSGNEIYAIEKYITYLLHQGHQLKPHKGSLIKITFDKRIKSSYRLTNKRIQLSGTRFQLLFQYLY